MILTASVFSNEMDILDNAVIEDKTTGNKTTTDAAGRFSMTVESEDTILRISAPGYDYDEFTAGFLKDYGRAELYLTNSLSEVPVTNNYSKSDNTLWYVLGGVAALGILYAMAGNSKQKPIKVKV